MRSKRSWVPHKEDEIEDTSVKALGIALRDAWRDACRGSRYGKLRSGCWRPCWSGYKPGTPTRSRPAVSKGVSFGGTYE